MNAPTLLIGLGGTGCKIIERVSKLVTDEQRSNIAFAVFDTDINDLRGIQERNPFIKTIQTSTKQTVGEYLNKDTHARDTWFPVNAILNGKTLTEGAGQVRSISRLALETVIRAGKMEPLHEAIQSLYKVEEDKVEQALRVIIVSSLAGGTGSGLILPVALYTKNYLATHFRLSANITRGFFILPEVFYEVITGQTERNNLKANAYATLRELDAFLMKGDATLPEKYERSVKMQFPKASSNGYEEYNIRPYDFCFLFDAQNAEGGKLNSFDQYLDHAANCIYAQSIGPMNKRSNSSEDNTIRKLAKEHGRNRYAGAGASMLIYPFEDIRKLIALKWTKQCVSMQWMEYDNLYNELCKENNQKREEGLAVKEQTLTSFYVNQIESAAKHDDAFANAIIRSTGRYVNGVRRISNRWEEYVTAVLEKTAVDLEDNSSEISSKREDAREQIMNLGNDWEEYIGAYTAADEYRLMSNAYMEEVAQTIAYSMFKGSGSDTASGKEFKLETYLVNNDGAFLHPNAIRYMLIKILDLMKRHKEAIDRDKKDNKDYFDAFEKNTFDDPDSPDVEEGVDDLTERKISVLNKLTKRPTGEQEEIKRKLRQYFDNIEEYQVQCAQSYVLGRGIEYIQSIVEAFESFYNSFESKVDELDKNIAEICKKYSSSKGTTVRYVCASPECLKKIYEKKPYKGSAIAIDSKLAKNIYQSVLAYAMDTDKPNNNRYFNKLFDEGIIGYFENAVMKDYGGELDIDVISAIEKEADYEGRYEEENNAYDLIQQYTRKVISDTRNLSCPFIESPLGEAREPINACTFHTSLMPEKGDESPRAQLIRKELMNFGGEPDEDISKNTIMFYQSFYGLRANDLSKFAPPEKSLTYDRSSGEYFKAYYELIDGIHPESHRSREISPHIDRWWHIITKMPDLDEENQKRQEYDIYAAFFWAVVNRYVYLTEEGSDAKVYKLRNILLRMEDDTLVVSNGTECDKLYEVLDAIAIYPELIRQILTKVKELTQDDLNTNSSLENGMLFSALRTFYIEEPGIGPDNVSSENIFDIPMLMKKSATPDIYYEANVIEMLRVEIEEIKKYLSNFCSQKELPEIMGKIILAQFEKHLESVALESKSHPMIYRESLFDKTCDTITNALYELGLKKEAQYVQEKASGLRR
ncbi:hypothetical protein B5E77_10165 [Lachnoclostridium sp. An131]|uniref:tubulin-like doman-containing protein n=1 Tax=Lachnoclostridium sp. An131 TaxID=1965555 RepID=UPI000B38B947|nr:tubulin-like doman-containing protein [Lachnoclostridium sp. An131]OUQ25834.1 hypothetical protein B5E77_10165 [Lachnoclostridium sp. An131]